MVRLHSETIHSHYNFFSSIIIEIHTTSCRETKVKKNGLIDSNVPVMLVITVDIRPPSSENVKAEQKSESLTIDPFLDVHRRSLGMDLLSTPGRQNSYL